MWTAVLLRQDGTWVTKKEDAAPPHYQTSSYDPHGKIHVHRYDRIAMDPLSKFLIYAPAPAEERPKAKGARK